MRRVAVASAIVVFLLSSGVMAGISQGFSYSVGMGGTLNWTGIGGGAYESRTGVTNAQTANSRLAFGSQSMSGTFTSTASASGLGASILTAQDITSTSVDAGIAFGSPSLVGQVQNIGVNVGPIGQTQGNLLGSVQNLPAGDSTGTNTFSLAENQTTDNNVGVAVEGFGVTGPQIGISGGNPVYVNKAETGIAIGTVPAETAE